MWEYTQPVTIRFAEGVIHDLPGIISEKKWHKGVLIAAPHVVKHGLANLICHESQGVIQHIFSDITPNPTLSAVDACAAMIRKEQPDFVVAIGGGSVLDLAKAAIPVGETTGSIREYYRTGRALPVRKAAFIAIPTTAGTGSEVTSVAVLSDPEEHRKAPLSSLGFFPDYALIDPELTYDMPPYITACSGIDVLSHAIEGYWSIHHQPICDALAIQAIQLVFQYLRRAVMNGQDVDARHHMCEASLLAGLAFALSKTTSAHACSFPLTNIYGIPHGEACGLTLDYFVRVNGKRDERTRKLAKILGFTDYEDLADTIEELKRTINLRCDLTDFHLKQGQVEALVEESHHPNLLNNPVPITDDILYNLYRSLL